MSLLTIKLEIANGMTFGELRKFVSLAEGRPDDEEIQIAWLDDYDVPVPDAFVLEVEPEALKS